MIIKRPKFSGLFVVALLFSSLQLFAQNDYRIEQINISGNVTFSDNRISELMSFHGKTGLKKVMFWLKSDVYNENLLDSDIQNIVRFYQKEGFIDVKITRKVDRNNVDRTVKIEIIIDEGIPAKVRTLETGFMPPISDSLFIWNILSDLKAKFAVKQDQRFRDENILKDIEKLNDVYSNGGYLFTSSQAVTELDSSKEWVDVVYKTYTGPRCKFGKASVRGNTYTPASLILKQLAFRENQIYSQELLQKSQRQIYQLGVFQFVTVRVSVEDSTNRILPVDILVKEAPRLTGKIGAGYGREDQFRTFIDARRLGFLGGARWLNLDAKHSYLEPVNLNVKLTQPAFMNPLARISLNPFYLRQREVGFSVNRIGVNVSYQQRFAAFTDGYFKYTLEQDNLRMSAGTRAEALANSDITLYNKSSVTIGLAHDNSTPIFNPQQGRFTAVTWTLSGIGFKSDFHYSKILLEGKQYYRVSNGYVLACRAKIGSMNTLYNDPVSPIEERFYAGGSMSIRGWARMRLSPQSKDGVPLGGHSLLELSTEVRYPLYGLVRGVVFFEGGNVWRTTLSYPLSELRYAGGFGLRFRTPIGPIRLDLAAPIGEGKQPIQVHVSVGQAY